MIIKSIHVDETDLKNVTYLTRLSDEKEFMISLRSELLGENLVYYISLNIWFVLVLQIFQFYKLDYRFFCHEIPKY